MSFKKIGIIVAIVLLVIVGGLIFLRDQVLAPSQGGRDITDLSSSYEAKEEIEAAREALGKPIEPADIMVPLMDNSPRVAIVIDGLPERPLCAKLIDVLNKHQVKAAFFVEGQNAANQPETMQLLQDAGMTVGNYGFVGVNALEKLDVIRQLSELCRTQVVVDMQIGKKPVMFRSPYTVYTDPLLKAARASGLEYAVKENVWVPRGMFTSDAVASSYVSTLPLGAILAIRVSHPVNPLVEKPGKTDEKPAFDMKPTISDDKKAPAQKLPDLDTELDLLLTALEKRGLKVIPVQEFRRIRYIPAAAVAQPPKTPGKPASAAAQGK